MQNVKSLTMVLDGGRGGEGRDERDLNEIDWMLLKWEERRFEGIPLQSWRKCGYIGAFICV